MKTIIFSDTHLGKKFNNRKFEYLKDIISDADQVIINGDFCDSTVKLNKFLESEWKRLFPLLKKKNTIYIYGNHDPKSFWDNKAKIFSIKQVREYEFKAGTVKYVVTHGDSIAPGPTEVFLEEENIHPISKKFWNLIEHISKFFYGIYFFLNMETILNVLTRGRWLRIFEFQNKKMKNYANENMKKNEILICGHSHLAEFDLKNKFINNGIINHRLAEYLKIDENGVELISERY